LALRGLSAFNGGTPFCEDFNERMLCSPARGYPYAGDPTGGQRNACADVAAAGLGDGVQTTCGNGAVEPFEECDFGTLGLSVQRTNGSAVPFGQRCTTTCRIQ